MSTAASRGMGTVVPGWIFFFSSRRRHTRYWRDWSSDVCSSDLSAGLRSAARGLPGPQPLRLAAEEAASLVDDVEQALYASKIVAYAQGFNQIQEIGRASCRERVQISAVPVSLQKPTPPPPPPPH